MSVRIADLVGEAGHELGEQRRRLDHVGVGVDHLHRRHHQAPLALPSKTMTLRTTSPASMARKASLMSSSPIRAAHHALGVDGAPRHQVDHGRGSRGRGRSSRRRSRRRVLAPTKSSKALKLTCSEGDPAPTSTAVPPRRARRRPDGWSGPGPPPRRRSRRPGPRSGPGRRPPGPRCDESTTWVAPMAVAAANLAPIWSTATMADAPARRAPWIDRQTHAAAADHGHRRTGLHPGGVPDGADPGGQGAPTRAASSRGAAAGRRRPPGASGTRVSSAKVAVPRPRMSLVPSDRGVGPPIDSAMPGVHSMG